MAGKSNSGAVSFGERRFVNRTKNLEGFDRLPKAIKKAIAEGEITWATDNILSVMRKRKLKTQDVVELIRDKNRENYLAAYPGIEEYLS